MTRIEGRDLMLSESPIPSKRAKQQRIVITSSYRQLPDLLNVNAIIAPTRALPSEETAEAA